MGNDIDSGLSFKAVFIDFRTTIVCSSVIGTCSTTGFDFITLESLSYAYSKVSNKRPVLLDDQYHFIKNGLYSWFFICFLTSKYTVSIKWPGLFFLMLFIFISLYVVQVVISGLLSLGVPGVPWHTQILADQLTLFQPGRARPDWAYEFPDRTRPDTKICWTGLNPEHFTA